MRLRNISGSREQVAESRFVVQEPECHKGAWKEFFGNEHPLHIEIGTGKGKFLTALSTLNPDINYLGIEKYSSVLLRALQKREEMEECRNLYFLRFDAEEILNLFDRGEVARIYLNFSDPWPKARHAKRRLTSVEFLERYEKVLKPYGKLEFKTDNTELFKFSLEQIKEAGWTLQNFTYDLHHNEEMNQGNIMTEYEEKFSCKGNPINKLIAVRK